MPLTGPAGYLKRGLRAISMVFGKELPMAIGFELYKRTEDRRVLEREIFPYFLASPDYLRVLFVGCAYYTRGYNKRFRHKDYSTLECDPAERRYGARQHIVDTLENITDHFGEGELDLIVCNGVFGWGLNEMTAVEEAFRGCYQCLRDGGVLVLGWNDIPERRPIAPADCPSLRLFQPFVFPPFAAAERRTATYNNHTYTFFVKASPE